MFVKIINLTQTMSDENGTRCTVIYKEAANADAIDAAPAQYAVTLWTDDFKALVDAFMAMPDQENESAIIEHVKRSAQDMVAQVRREANFKLSKVTRHISTDGMHVYFDNADFGKVQLDATLEDHLVRLLTEQGVSGRDFKSYAAFAERLYANTDERIREQFVRWMAAQKWMTFTEDGCFIGYRGCQVNANTGIAESIHCGPAVVDGEIVNGHVPNPDGAVVEIDRSLVKKDAAVGCASGLHVGTYDYALDWARGGGADAVLLRVKVAPEDVVSVPFDCDAKKVRCCRFEVCEHTPLTKILGDTWFEDSCHAMTYGCDDDYDEDWGEEDDGDTILDFDEVRDMWDSYGPGEWECCDSCGNTEVYDCYSLDDLCDAVSDWDATMIDFVSPFDDDDCDGCECGGDHACDSFDDIIVKTGDVIESDDAAALNALAARGGEFVSFGYTNRNGENVEVAGTVEEQDAILNVISVRQNGTVRHYAIERITTPVRVGAHDDSPLGCSRFGFCE